MSEIQKIILDKWMKIIGGECPCGGHTSDWHSHASDCIVINPKGKFYGPPIGSSREGVISYTNETANDINGPVDIMLFGDFSGECANRIVLSTHRQGKEKVAFALTREGAKALIVALTKKL